MSLRSPYIYRVQPGDTIVSISRKFGIKLADLIKTNPQIENPVQLTPGEELYIPLKGAAQD